MAGLALWWIDNPDKPKQVLHQLRRRVAVRWAETPLDQALVQISRAGGVLAQFQPALWEGVEQGSRQITWQTPDESIIQVVETLAARTGLAYEIREDSLYFFGPRGFRGSLDPMVGMITIPSRTGLFSYQVFVRKSQLPKETQANIDQQTKSAIEAMAKEFGQPKN